MTTTRLDQQMAGAAARIVAAVPMDRALRTRYRQLPTLLRMSGFAAGYATILGRIDTSTLGRAYAAVAEGIRAHLAERHLLTAGTPLALIAALEGLTAAEYARVGAEARALAGWLSRLAEATYRAEEAARGPDVASGDETAGEDAG